MNILLLDGGKTFGHSNGQLNHTLHATAREVLVNMGHQVQETVIEQGYDITAEIEKFLWMDAVIWQMPGWWMGEPWTVKNTLTKYLPQDTANYIKAMVVTVLIRQRDMARAVYWMVKNICFRLLGMHR